MTISSPPLPERIEGPDGLVIRRWLTADIPAMAELITSSLEHLRPWMAWADREPLSDDRRRRMFRRWDAYWAAGRGAVYGVLLDGQLIGGCALHRRVGPGGLDIGYWLGRDHVGRGHATRICRALTATAFALDDVTFLEISHEATNESSAAVARRLGFDLVAERSTAEVTTWRLDKR